MVYGRIYTIRSHQTPKIYIGSTTQILSKRMADHRVNYKAYLNKNYHYTTSFEILKYGDAYIELLFESEFKSRNALERKEGEYQREMDCVNKMIAGRTQKEYYEDNREYILERNHKFYEDNKEKILEVNKRWGDTNKEKMSVYKKQWAEENKERIAEQKKYLYDRNKEEILEYQKKYREENKERIQERKQKTYECRCGVISLLDHKARHERSKKHQAFIQSLSAVKNCVEVHSSSCQSVENCEAVK